MLVLIATPALASDTGVDRRGTIINADYSVAAPLGETRSHTSSNSAQGLGLDVRVHGEKLKWGLGTSWQVFRERRQAPGTLTGAEFEDRTTSLLPVLATGYYVWRHGAMRTFVGAGVGAMMSRLSLEAQAEKTVDITWYVAASGVAGAVYELTPGFGLESKFRYVGGYKSSYKPVGMMQLTLGFVFFY
jgi:hypothetical protein